MSLGLQGDMNVRGIQASECLEEVEVKEDEALVWSSSSRFSCLMDVSCEVSSVVTSSSTSTFLLLPLGAGSRGVRQ